jgi:hypothetical protein
VAPPLSLPQVAALIARASLAIGVDTGLAHLAAALRVPVIALYIATDPALTGVYGSGFVRNLGGAGAPPSVSEVLTVAEQACADERVCSIRCSSIWPCRWSGCGCSGERAGSPSTCSSWASGTASTPRVQLPLLWLHAVSVGETRAAEPLIDSLLRAYPGHGVLLTHMTPTGRATGQELLARHPGRLTQAYLPYDLPAACGRFLDHFQPQIGLLMETEVWPNLIEAARRRKLPMALINARLSARSQRGYARLPSLIRPALASLSALRRRPRPTPNACSRSALARSASAATSSST